MPHPRQVIAILAASISFTAIARAGSGSITRIAPLDGESQSVALSVNSSGEVLGRSGSRVFLWSTPLGLREVTQVDAMISAEAINDAGVITGRSWWPENNWQGFTWSASQGQTNLGSLGGIRSEPAALSNRDVVVGTSTVHGGSLDHAFRWTAASGMQDLGTLGSDHHASHATGVSDTGAIVGHSSLGVVTHAFRWTESNAMQDLGTLGGANSVANSISANGETTVGWSENVDGWNRAFQWTSQNGMRELATLGGLSAGAVDVNDAGAVVGQAAAANSEPRAVLWTRDSVTPIDINHWLAAVNPTAAADWALHHLAAINNSGQIVGFGSYRPDDWQFRAFILDVSGIPGVAVPEPVSVIPLIGIFALGRFRVDVRCA